MQVVEGGADANAILRSDLLAHDGDRKVELLPHVTQVQKEVDFHPVLSSHRMQGALKLGNRSAQSNKIKCLQGRGEGSHRVVPLVRHQHAESGEMRGKPGNDDSGDTKLTRYRNSVQRPGSARSHQGEVTRIITLLD